MTKSNLMHIVKSSFGHIISEVIGDYTISFAFHQIRQDDSYNMGDSFAVYTKDDMAVTKKFGYAFDYMDFDGTFETMHQVYAHVKNQYGFVALR